MLVAGVQVGLVTPGTQPQRDLRLLKPTRATVVVAVLGKRPHRLPGVGVEDPRVHGPPHGAIVSDVEPAEALIARRFGQARGLDPDLRLGPQQETGRLQLVQIRIVQGQPRARRGGLRSHREDGHDARENHQDSGHGTPPPRDATPYKDSTHGLRIRFPRPAGRRNRAGLGAGRPRREALCRRERRRMGRAAPSEHVRRPCRS